MNILFKVTLAVVLLCPLGSLAQEVSKEEVIFTNEDYVLNGTLVLPASPQNVPVLLFMGGIEEWGDFHPSRESFIYENLVNIFPQNGIAVMYYDPRGLGESTGRWQRATLPDFAEDAKAAIKFLKQRQEIDSSRIGIIGHGEDGWIAQIVAADNPNDLKMMVSIGGPVFDAQTLLTNQYHNEYVCAGQDSAEAYERARQKAISHENWVSIFPLTKKWRHMKLKQDFDPAEKLKHLNVPSLFVFGENDGEVYPSWSINYLHELFPGSLPSNFNIQVIPGANHYFKVADRCYDNEDISVHKNYSFRFNEVLRNWVFNKL
ncbi:MAG: alpha/beta hydrolase [Balneolaceae bacterium]